MSESNSRPIIIKRKKVIAGGGHHGGAWKVAYADFVTAMMAFFMLMWLLNATTEKQRKGLADYFSPTIAIARVSGGGDGAFSGDSLMSEQTLAQSGRGGLADLPPMEMRNSGGTALQEDGTPRDLSELEEVQLGLVGRGGDSLVEDLAKKHITARLSDRGLIIEIHDLEGSPLFEAGTKIPTQIMREIAALVTPELKPTTHEISVSAHSAVVTPLQIDNPSWQITTDRAQATRILLEDKGLDAERVVRVTGHGQQKPFLPNPMAVENNRLEIVLLRQDLDQ